VPPPDDSVTTTPLTDPEQRVVSEKTAAPQQPYEAAQIGEITPERAADPNIPEMSAAASPAIVEQEREGTVASPNDLVIIDGIGAKSAAALRAAGIDSFQKLANASPDQIRAALAAAKVRVIGEVESWSHQAAYAAREDWAGMRQFNRERRSSGA
jgi:predicted flap endonuclease-1-like 5' DNA nuclease